MPSIHGAPYAVRRVTSEAISSAAPSLAAECINTLSLQLSPALAAWRAKEHALSLRPKLPLPASEAKTKNNDKMKNKS